MAKRLTSFNDTLDNFLIFHFSFLPVISFLGLRAFFLLCQHHDAIDKVSGPFL